jgi:hypothetical protein
VAWVVTALQQLRTDRADPADEPATPDPTDAPTPA